MAHLYAATVIRQRGDQPFADRKYSRGHAWHFDGGVVVPASSSPLVVAPPLSREDAVDPEEAFAAALSSCHMLFFLELAAKAGFRIDRYEDHATAEMGKRPDGRICVAKVTLHPSVTWSGEMRPSAEDIAALHHRSHERCFIASSVTSEVAIAEVAPIYA